MENRTLKLFAANTQKELFLIAYHRSYDVIDFINKYMRSNLCKKIDSPYSYWQNQCAERIFEEYLDECPNTKINSKQQYNEDAIEWLGFFYRMWHFITKETSNQIVRILPPLSGIRQWYTLHQLDEKTAIEIVKTQYNNKQKDKREYWYKKNKLKPIYTDLRYYSFLSKRILYKFKRTPLFKELEYTFDDDYDFTDVNNRIGIKTAAIFNNGTISIIDVFDDYNKKIVNYPSKVDTSIFFCFVFEESYSIDDGSFKNDLFEIICKYTPDKRHYDYLYFYIDGNLYEINPSNEINATVIPVGLKERETIEKEMKTTLEL